MGNRNKNENIRNLKKSDSNNTETQKKPFNKKKYREQKYSNKFKVAQWEEKRKKALLRDLYKDLKKDEKASRLNVTNKNDSSQQFDDKGQQKIKKPFFSAKQEFLRKKKEQEAKKQELIKAEKERTEALKKYKEKKMRTFRELSKKTKKGQPVMRGRMELLLEKIQQRV